jgi:hypothetical protein
MERNLSRKMREERQLENQQYEDTSSHQRRGKDDSEISSLHSEKENGSSLDQLLSKAIRDKNGQPDSPGMICCRFNETNIFNRGKIK